MRPTRFCANCSRSPECNPASGQAVCITTATLFIHAAKPTSISFRVKQRSAATGAGGLRIHF